jgi:hypothetical protein
MTGNYPKTRMMQRDYWAAVNKLLAAGRPISGNKQPQPQFWMSYPIGRSGFRLNAVMIRPKNQIRAELYISGDRAKAFLGLLKNQKRELGYLLSFGQQAS